MSNDERAHDVSDSGTDGEADTARIHGSAPEPAAASQTPGRWSTVTGSARQHPVGVAIGSAAVGLVVGLLGGLAANAHPMMSFTVGTAAVPASADRLYPGPPPPRDMGGPGLVGPQGPGGPVGPGVPPPPPPPGVGPRGPVGDGPDGAPRPGEQLMPPPDRGPAPTSPGTSPGPRGAGPDGGAVPNGAVPNGEAPQLPPLPAERGGAPQGSGT